MQLLFSDNNVKFNPWQQNCFYTGKRFTHVLCTHSQKIVDKKVVFAYVLLFPPSIHSIKRNLNTRTVSFLFIKSPSDFAIQYGALHTIFTQCSEIVIKQKFTMKVNDSDHSYCPAWGDKQHWRHINDQAVGLFFFFFCRVQWTWWDLG